MGMPLGLRGLIAAPHTPMRADESVNLEAIARQARLLVETGVAGAFLCGSTGEGHSLSVAERRAITEKWVAEAGADLAVIVHVGHNSLPEARELAAHAEQSGAAAVAAMAPSYYRPESVEDLVGFFAQIAEAAPRLPFYFYHIPATTGVDLAPARFLEFAGERIPTLGGIKYSSLDLMGLQECLAVGDGAFDVFFGADELLLAGLALGAHGAVGSTFNYAAPLYHRLMRAFEAGDLAAARADQLKSVRLVRAIVPYGVLRGGKALMAMIGVDCGPPRKPVRAMSERELRELYEAVREMDVFAQPLREPSLR